MTLETWADPGVDRYVHSIEVDADSARFMMTTKNVPSVANPHTGRITALGIVARLRKIHARLRVGT